MKGPRLLPLFLLGTVLRTVSALYLENGGPHLDSPKAEAELGHDLAGAGEQEGDTALTQVIQTEGEEAEASGHQDAFEHEEDAELDPAALDKDLACPKEEDTVPMQGSPGCKTCRYLLVQTPHTFHQAQHVCRRCYRGNLVSIHNYNFNYHVQCSASMINQAHVWIGGMVEGWFLCQRFRWTDGSCWNFGYWAPGQPGCGVGHCVALCTRGGHWQRAHCQSQLPFVCSY